MQPNDENPSENNLETPQPEMTPGAQPPMPSEPVMEPETPPEAPVVDSYSQPPVSTPPTPPIPPSEPVSFQPPATETGVNPQPAPVVVEPPKPAGFFGKIKSMFSKK